MYGPDAGHGYRVFYLVGVQGTSVGPVVPDYPAFRLRVHQSKMPVVQPLLPTEYLVRECLQREKVHGLDTPRQNGQRAVYLPDPPAQIGTQPNCEKEVDKIDTSGVRWYTLM